MCFRAGEYSNVHRTDNGIVAWYNKLTKKEKGCLPQWRWSGNRITASVSLSIKTDEPVAPHYTRPRPHNSIQQCLWLGLIFIYLTALKPHIIKHKARIKNYNSQVTVAFMVYVATHGVHSFISWMFSFLRIKIVTT